MSKYEAIFSNVLATSVMPVIKQESVRIAEKIRKEVIRRIEQAANINQWPELSPRYLKRKIKYGYASKVDPRMLMMTRQYIKSIVVTKTKYGATVGVKDIMHWTPTLTGKVTRPRTNPKTIARSGGKAVPMVLIAEWLEYGTTMSKVGRGGPKAGQPWHIPPRPHWRPAQQKFIRELGQTRERITKAMSEAMQKALERELANASVGLGSSTVRFENEIQTRKQFDMRLNKASRMMNRLKRYEYQKANLPVPSDINDVEEI